jgi:tripartite-type tricarboxylate transporter receptor subunit TctC
MINSWNRRKFLSQTVAGALAGGLTPLASLAQQGYPSRPIKVISPWSAGGTSDNVVRAFTLSAAKHLGGVMVVENRPGAGGTMGAIELTHAVPDGYVLSQFAGSIYSIPHMQKVPFDPLKDLTYIARVSTYTNGLVVRADSPIRSVQDLVAYAKKNPGDFSFGSSGVGTAPHLAMEEFALKAGIKLQHIPYKADSESIQGLMSGAVMGMSGSTVWGPMVQAGTVRILATYGAKRTKRWPDAPTLTELGYPVPETPFGFGGPKGMDAALVNRLQEAFRAALSDPQVLAVLDTSDMQPDFLSSKDYATASVKAFEEQREIISRLGLANK